MELNWYNQNQSWIQTVECDFQKPIYDLQKQPNGSLVAIVMDKQIQVIDLDGHYDSLDIVWESPIYRVVWRSQQVIQIISIDTKSIIEIDKSLKGWKRVYTVSSTTKNHLAVRNRDEGDYLRSYFYSQQDYRKELNNRLDLNRVASYSVRGKLTVVGLNNGDVMIWDGETIQQYTWSHKNNVRVIQVIDETTFLSAGDDCEVHFWRKTTDTWSSTYLGSHTGWVYDCVIDGHYAYTVGADGIVCKWDLDQEILLESIPVNKGVASSLIKYKDSLYVGHHLGKLVRLDKVEDDVNRYHKNSIWNMHVLENKLFTGGSDGQIICSDIHSGEVIASIETSCGWINGFDHVSTLDCIVAVSSEGDLIFWDGESPSYEVYHTEKYWFNNVKERNGTLYLASAKGEVVVFDLASKCVKKTLTNHKDQILDLAVHENTIISASVDGMICFWDSDLCTGILYLNIHSTSIAINDDTLIVASLEGDLFFIDLNKRSIYYIHRNAHNGRIWKVSTCGGWYISTIGTDRLLKLWTMNGELVSSWNDNDLLTTCLLTPDQVFIANNNGEFKALLVPDEDKRKVFPYSNEHVIFVDHNPVGLAAFTRLQQIMKELDLEFTVVQVQENQELKQMIYKRSGWNQYPQAFFNGQFIGAGSVLMEMHRTKALRRLVNRG